MNLTKSFYKLSLSFIINYKKKHNFKYTKYVIFYNVCFLKVENLLKLFCLKKKLLIQSITKYIYYFTFKLYFSGLFNLNMLAIAKDSLRFTFKIADF